MSSLLEFTVSLLLIAIVGTAVVTSSRPLFHHSLSAASRAREIVATAKIAGTVRRLVHLSDHARLPLLPRVKRGALSFFDGASIQTTRHNLPDSAAIYFLNAYSSPTALRDRRLEDGKLLGSYCSAEVVLEESDFIGLTVDGIFELHGSISQSESDLCKRVSLVPTPSVVTERLHPDALLTVSALVPLRERGVLFVDSEQTARLIRFNGARIIENQPLVANAPALSLNSFHSNGIQGISGDLLFGSGRAFSISAQQTLSAADHLLALLGV